MKIEAFLKASNYLSGSHIDSNKLPPMRKTIISYYIFFQSILLQMLHALLLWTLCCFLGFKRIIRIGFFVYIFLLLSLTKGEKLQQLNVKIENGPLKSVQTHFDPTMKLQLDIFHQNISVVNIIFSIIVIES